MRLAPTDVRSASGVSTLMLLPLKREARLALLLLVSGACSTSEPRVPTTVTVDPASVSFTALNQTQQLTALVSDQSGDPLSEAAVTWTTSDNAVATVNSSGLVTATGGGTAQVTATSGSVEAVAQVSVTLSPNRITKISGDGQSAVAGELLADSLVVEVRDTSQNLVAGATVVFTITQGGGIVGSSTVVTNAEGRASTTLTTGKVAGPQGVSARVASTFISVTFTAIAVPGPAAAVILAGGNNQHVPAGSMVPVRPTVVVTDENDNPVAGVAVEFEVVSGGGSVAGGSAVTDTEGRAQVGGWELGPSNPNLLRVTAAGLQTECNPATFTASAASPPEFEVEVRFLSCVTTSQLEAFTQAEERWERLVSEDIENVPIDEPAGSCDDSTPDLNETIDDLIVFASVDSIDGPGDILGQAGPCFIRDADSLPAVGVMFFDNEDLEFLQSEGLLRPVILHEMGHVLGFGTLWELQNLLVDPADNAPPAEDPHFTGPEAIAAFDDVGGSSYTGEKVPVEETGGPGTMNSHWRNSVFRNELMTGFVDRGTTNPLSAVSVASLADQGYSVDIAASDPYSLPPASLVFGEAPRALRLENDVRQIPIKLLDRTGRLVGTVRP